VGRFCGPKTVAYSPRHPWASSAGIGAGAIAQTYRAFETVDKYAYRASPQEIADKDFNLNISRYVDTFEEEAEI
jgi:hypothetical protein